MATKKATDKPETNLKDEAVPEIEPSDINQLKDVIAEDVDPKLINELPEEPKKDSWSEMVNIIVPRRPRGEDQFYYICVNDRRFQIPADGKMQQLPKPVAEILEQSLAAEAAADKFAEEIPNNTGPDAGVIG